MSLVNPIGITARAFIELAAQRRTSVGCRGGLMLVILAVLGRFQACTACGGHELVQGSRRLASWRKGSQGKSAGIYGAGVMRLRGGVSTSVGFQWNKDGSERLKLVEVAGTWDGWLSRHKLSYTEAQGWTGSLNLEPGRYEYKFILDDSQWTHSEDEPKQVCAVGVFNNVLQVAEPSAYPGASGTDARGESAEKGEGAGGDGGGKGDWGGHGSADGHGNAGLSKDEILGKAIYSLDIEALEQAEKERKEDAARSKTSLWENTTPWHAAAVQRAAERKRAEEVHAVLSLPPLLTFSVSLARSHTHTHTHFRLPLSISPLTPPVSPPPCLSASLYTKTITTMIITGRSRVQGGGGPRYHAQGGCPRGGYCQGFVC